MALINKSHTFSAGNTIIASQHNDNFDVIYALVNGKITDANIKDSAAIGNTKLAAPKSYFTVPLTADGQFTTAVTSLRTFQMPFAATLVEVSACARDIDTGDADEAYSVDVLEAGTSVLSAVINLVADDTPVVGTVSDSSLADNAKITVDLDMGGTSPTLDDLTVLLTFKTSHVA